MPSHSAFTLQLPCQSFHRGSQQSQWPPARSAHSSAAGLGGRVLVAAGDAGAAGCRHGDLWELAGLPGGSPKWSCISSHDKGSGSSNDSRGSSSSSFTPRSNAAAAAAGDWLLLFGGWSESGLEPLGHLEAVHLPTGGWFDAPALAGMVAGSPPSPRGQPAAAADAAGAAVYVFGGWDGASRLNDLHRLELAEPDPSGWRWRSVQPLPPADVLPAAAAAGKRSAASRQAPVLAAEEAPERDQQHRRQQQQQQQAALLPCARADHVMAAWHYCDDGVWKDLLVVFGGSSAAGLLNDTWLFDINTSAWRQAFHGGAAPCARSSAAAAVKGDVLLLHGGQTPAGVLHDMHLLHLSTLTWVQVDLGPLLQPLCRHSMAVSGSCCWMYGGYDGEAASDALVCIDLLPVEQLQRSSIQQLAATMVCCGARSADGSSPAAQQQQGSAANAGAAAAAAALPAVARVLCKKAALLPLKLEDLPNAAQVAAMPQWKQVRHLHQAALAAGCDTYVDPASGYTVFTASYLRRRQCCGNKCRHCPHGWANVRRERLEQPQLPAPAVDDW